MSHQASGLSYAACRLKGLTTLRIGPEMCLRDTCARGCTSSPSNRYLRQVYPILTPKPTLYRRLPTSPFMTPLGSTRRPAACHSGLPQFNTAGPGREKVEPLTVPRNASHGTLQLLMTRLNSPLYSPSSWPYTGYPSYQVGL